MERQGGMGERSGDGVRGEEGGQSHVLSRQPTKSVDRDKEVEVNMMTWLDYERLLQQPNIAMYVSEC